MYKPSFAPETSKTEQLELIELLTTVHTQLKQNILLRNPLEGCQAMASLCSLTELNPQELSIIAVLRGMGGRYFQAEQASVEQVVRQVFDDSQARFRETIQELMYKGILEIEPRRFRSTKIGLTEKAEESIVSNDPSFFSGKIPSGLTSLLNVFREEMLNYHPMRRNQFFKSYGKMVESNSDLTLIKYLEDEQLQLSPIDKFVVLATVSSYLLHNRPFNLDYLFEFVRFDSISIMMLQMSISQSTWDSIAKGYIKVAGGGLIDRDVEIELTMAGVDFFLAELDPSMIAQIKIRSMKKLNIISPDKIESVPLILTDSLQQQYDRLNWLLSEENLTQYTSMLDQGERMRGISALMYGSPGTGKTQMVYNLAKATDRGIVELNIDMILSKWFGESQVKLREFLQGYRSLVERSERAPILFLNEADQIFMKRLSVGTAVDQTLNNLQNIVLTELEQFPEGGILMATTNLVDNFDPATERRILMKLKFEKPSLEVRQQVWKSILPDLSSELYQPLAKEFDLAPGEIRNIAKKFKLEKFLSRGKIDDLQILRNLAKEERYSESEQKKAVGF